METTNSKPSDKMVYARYLLYETRMRAYRVYKARLLLVIVIGLITLLVTNALTFAIATRSRQSEAIVSEYVVTNSDIEVLPEISTDPDGLYIPMSVPEDASGAFKTYMDYRTITDTTTKQWGLQLLATTNEEGFRVYDGYYLVAMGTHYTNQVGDVFRITLDSGISIDVMVGDIKDNKHTDETNRYIEHNGNIVEFIVDANAIAKTARVAGDISILGLEGGVSIIEKRIVRY